MKIKIKQLDERVCKMIAAALTIASEDWRDEQGLENISIEASMLAVEFRHDIFLQVTEQYPQDDVQVLGKQEKGGE